MTNSQVQRCFIALILLARLASVAWASGPDDEELTLAYGDNATVSIATGSQQTLRRVPAVATVITAADIAAMGATDLDQVLETVPGVHVSYSPNSYAPVYVIRGIFSQLGPQTLVLQNGQPISEIFVGNRGNVWAGMSVENIARIEVIRGPGSALYGADAYSGVINIISKRAADIHGMEFGVRGGAFRSGDTWLQHGGNWGPFAVAANLHVGGTDGFKAVVTSDAQTRNDKAFGTHASLAPGAVNAGRKAIDASLDLEYAHFRLRNAYRLRDDVGTGPGIASALDPNGKSYSERISSDLSWADPQFAANWSLGVNASFVHYKEIFSLFLYPAGVTFPTGTFPDGMFGAPNRWQRQSRLSGFAVYSGMADHSLRIGMGHDDLNLYKIEEHKNFAFAANGLPTPVGPIIDFTHIAPFVLPHRRRIDYLYLQDEWRLGKDWALTLGVRDDHYSEFGTTRNPRLALVWDARYDLTVKLLYGQAFRAPSLNEEFSINNPVTQGNANLRPETIRTSELAFAWQARTDLQLNLSLFHSELADIIRTVPNATLGTGSSYFNIGSQRGHGVELESVWDISRSLRLSGNYAYQRAIDNATGQDAGNAPRQHVYGRLDWRLTSGWQLGAQVNRVADRKRAVGDTRPEMGDDTAVDLGLQLLRGKQRWSFAAGVKNLFNADLREPSVTPGLIADDIPLAGRSWFVQATYRM